MIVSGTILKNAYEKYAKTKGQENFKLPATLGDGMEKTIGLISIAFAILLFALELLVLIYALNIAWTCTKTGPERIVHFVLAVTFTLPYMLFSVMLNPCATSYLRTTRDLFPKGAPIVE